MYRWYKSTGRLFQKVVIREGVCEIRRENNVKDNARGMKRDGAEEMKETGKREKW